MRGIDLYRESTMMLAGMGCDPEVARYGARWRATEHPGDAGYLERVRSAFAEPLTATSVVGTMPNIVANRLNAQLDLAGPSFTVSAEQDSGTVALHLAAHALRASEADAAVVAAVDLSVEPVHQQALAELGEPDRSGDVAVALVLKRLATARADGDPVLAVLAEDDDGEPDIRIGPDGFDPVEAFGSGHAADGLLAIAVAALALRHR